MTAPGAMAENTSARRDDETCDHRVTVKDILRFVPGVMILLSVALGLWVSPGWFALAAFVGVNLLQSSVTKWCLLESILRKLGVPECPCRESA